MKLNKGDVITFGTYPQDKYGESVAPIEWDVLEVNGDEALIISDKILDMVTYNEEHVDITWENCTLRKWLNEDFIEKAFTDEEKEKIVPKMHDNPKNKNFPEIEGGADTLDKVFAFSIDEVKSYFPTKEERKAKATPYALQQGVYVYTETGYSCWWLRTRCFPAGMGGGSRVNVGGTISDLAYDDIRSHRGPRPVMWIKTED